MYRIVADSGCDIFELEGVSFGTAPLTINTDRDSFLDDENLDTHSMIETLLSHKGRSYTACPSTEAWTTAFDCEDGTAPDELYVVTLTSGLSGTYNSACVAVDLYQEHHPHTKAIVVDTLSVGPEMILVLEKIAQAKKDGQSFEEISAMIRGYCDKVRLFFAFKSLHNLAENGRVNKLVASAAGILGISAYGTANDQGQIQSLGKARGDKNVMEKLLKAMEEAGYHGGKVRITHTENPELAEKMADRIHAAYPEAEIRCVPVRGLCSYYCERGGLCIGCETN